MNELTPCRPARSSSDRSQHGYVLITSMLLLLLVTMLSTGLLRALASTERTGSATREKQHAFQAAQSALQYGEWWLTQNNATAGTACSGLLTSTQVCSNAPIGLTTLPWTVGSTYMPPAINGAAPMTVSTAGAANAYFALPQLYIQYLGTNPVGNARIYKLTAAGNGGLSDSVAVVQSTYSVSTGVSNLGGL
jgi:type IV pilus assembly protein PilX